MKRILCLTVILVFSFSTYGKPFGVRVMGNYISQQLYRGAVIWPEPSAIAGPMFVFYDKLFVAGPNIFFSPTSQKDQFQWKVGTNFFDDNEPPISFGDHERDFRNKRSSTIEIQSEMSYSFGPRGNYRVGALLAREVKEGVGLHSEFFVGAPLLPFTSFEARISWSEKAMAQYLYGPTSLSGAGFASFGINGVFPFVPWDGIIMANYTKFIVLQGKNKAANYVRNEDVNNVFSFRVFWNAF